MIKEKTVNMKDLVKQAAELSIPEDQKVGALAASAMEAGFSDVILKEAAKRGFQIEKTAAVSKKIAGREVTFSKMSFEDLMSHLTSQFSVPAKHDVDGGVEVRPT
jgi:hypothetical protein